MASTNHDFNSLFANLSHDLGDEVLSSVPASGPDTCTPAGCGSQDDARLVQRAPLAAILNLVDTTHELHSKSNGSTVSLRDGNLLGRKVFAVSVYPERSSELRVAPTRGDVLAFVLLNFGLLIRPAHAFGSWFNQTTGSHIFDVVLCVSDEQTALELGRKFRQTSVFDLATLREIPVQSGAAPSAVNTVAGSYNKQRNIDPRQFGQTDKRGSHTMKSFFEHIVARVWNRFRRRPHGTWHEGGSPVELGYRVVDEQITDGHLVLSTTRRTTHLMCVGKTGSGKSSLLRHMAVQDIQGGKGFAYFDMHGDTTPFLLKQINLRERREHGHLSDRVIVIQPGDPIVSIGMNNLEQETPDFVRITELAEVLKRRCGLDHFGVRIDEVLRNGLYVLSANGLTLVELPLLLTNAKFRAACMKRVANAEVKQYFESRYDQMSAPMQATTREGVLNKITAFTADPHFRHIVGQTHSSFSIKEALDEGYWILINLEKGRLGAQALTLGSLIFTALKNAIFTREKRSIFTLYCDEIQNLVSNGSDIETILAEARKFHTPIVSANQFLDQLPMELRSALLSVGSHAFFQLAPNDANQIAQALDGGRPLAERLKNLPQRHAVVKSGADRWAEIVVPTVREPDVDYTDLLNRARYMRGKVRAHIERDIAKRQAALTPKTDEVLHDWQ